MCSFLLSLHFYYLICCCSVTGKGSSSDSGGEELGSKNRNEVWRRYSEFEVLRNFLSVAYPFIVIPPLPEKAVSYLVYGICHVLYLLSEFLIEGVWE